MPFDSAWHSPLQRAAETAEIIAAKMPALQPEPSALLFDCIPSGPAPETPKVYDPFFGSVTEAEIEAGSAQMADAAAEFLTSHREDRHDLLITHNFVIAWLVREALGAPEWRWLSIHQANCGLTVLTQKSGRPWSLFVAQRPRRTCRPSSAPACPSRTRSEPGGRALRRARRPAQPTRLPYQFVAFGFSL